MQIYIGVSGEKTDQDVLEMLDVDPSDPEGRSIFERFFGSGYIRPGSFEVYGREDIDEGFTERNLKILFPFNLPPKMKLFEEEMGSLLTIFYVADDTRWPTDSYDGVRVTDVIEIERFSYE